MYKCFGIVLLFAVLVNAMAQEPQSGDGVVSAYKKNLLFAIACIAFPDYAAAWDDKKIKIRTTGKLGEGMDW
ncbi:hypothetical protein DdX_19392 [Ditylenchus destructor]|uniref:ABC transporter substrate-binding protein n=1 Tax=Ditylenchus destructor TaxID=166010 RepID=A0AAD4MN88_9BILA|nr:hypothetical protein DdX_19392 [Ditylenchus destructor]